MKGRRILSVEDLVSRVVEYNPQGDISLLTRAYEFSVRAHEGQIRRSGEPFVRHPFEVAGILTQLRLDVPSIAAGLLHDIVEDTSHTTEEIEKNFGKGIARLVEGVTKIGQIQFKSYEEKQAENFRKMIVSMAEDIRVVLVKLADRLHNMRTLGSLSIEKQKRISQETLEIYAPLANRLGIGWMKSELEDLCFRFLKPEVYASIERKVAVGQEEREQHIREVIEIVQKNMAEYGLKGEVVGRSKHLFSIYQKMERLGIPFEEVYDAQGIRMITDTKLACYGILGMIHSLWRPVPGRFKDYIGVPKSNMYQSLHTTVIGPRGTHVEFQIRTAEMHRVAEEGIAAHWKYKERGQIDEKDGRIFAWLRQMVEWQQDLADNRQFMESIKTDLFPDTVYVFTPKGDVKELVKGSTPVDFAYSVHTEVGNHCTGAKVNGKLVPLRYELKSGDAVEITTSPTQCPSKDWLKIVKTARAKAKIKYFIRVEERKRGLDIGRKVLERELKRRGLTPSTVFRSQEMMTIVTEAGFPTLEDLLVSLSYGKILASTIIHRLLPETETQETEKETKRPVEQRGIKIAGVDDILIRLSKCCSPVPGDRIIGFITRGRGVSIHAVDCPNIDGLDYDRDRIVEVDWETQGAATYPVTISVLTVDRPGLLAEVSASITAAQANISHAEATTTEDRKGILNFIVEVTHASHLEKILQNIEQVEGVLKASRGRRR